MFDTVSLLGKVRPKLYPIAPTIQLPHLIITIPESKYLPEWVEVTVEAL